MVAASHTHPAHTGGELSRLVDKLLICDTLIVLDERV
jgi:hypothetical protein